MEKNIYRKIIFAFERWLPIITVIVFVLHYTILKTYFNGIISDIKTYLLLLMGILFIVELTAFLKRDGLKQIINDRKIVIIIVLLGIFFVIRGITIIALDFEYSVIKEVVYEGIFLVAISQLTITKQFDFNLMAKWYITVITLINVLNIFTYEYTLYYLNSGQSANRLIMFFMQFDPVVNIGVMYTNSNTGGILTGIALLMSMLLFHKNAKYKRLIVFVLVWIIGIYSMYILFARSSYVAFVVAIVAMIILAICKRMKPDRVVLLCLICCVGVTAVLYATILDNYDKNGVNFTDNEQKINSLLSGRYEIWQDVIVANETNWLTGIGSYELEFEQREAYIIEKSGLEEQVNDGAEIKIMHIHSGYLGVATYAGLVGAIIFFIILGYKIYMAPVLRYTDKERCKSVIFAGILIYMLLINLIEPYFIGKRHVEFLLMMIILAWNTPNKGESALDE